jgi:hypothetical protein
MAHRWLARILARKRELRRNRRGTTIAGSVFQPGTNETSSNIQAQQATLVVGPAGSLFPITSTAASGGAAAVVNAALVYAVANNIGIVQLKGGPNVTYWLEASVDLIDHVDFQSDGAVLEAMNGAQFTPLIGNTAAQSHSALTYTGISLNGNAGNSGYTSASLTWPGFNTNVAFPATSLIGTLAGVTDPNGGGTIVVTFAGGTVTGYTLNGLAITQSAGSIYMTPSDTLTFQGSVQPTTFYYIQNIDLCWVYHSNFTRWIACVPWISGATSSTYAGPTAGVMASFNSAPNWVSGNNYVVGNCVIGTLNKSGYQCILNITNSTTDPSNDSTHWVAITLNQCASMLLDIDAGKGQSKNFICAGVRFYGASGNATANQRITNLETQSTFYRGFDIAQFADTFCGEQGTLRFPAGVSSSTIPVYVTMWIGSAGTPNNPAACDREYFGAVISDNTVAAKPDYVVLGWYNAITPSQPAAPGVITPSFAISKLTNPTGVVVNDLRATYTSTVTAWSSATTYSIGSVVSSSTSVYVSLINSNLNNLPTSTSSWGVMVNPIEDWDILSVTGGVRYKAGAIGQNAGSGQSQGFANQVAVPATGTLVQVALGGAGVYIVPWTTILTVKTAGTVTVVQMIDPSGSLHDLGGAALSVGQTLIVPAGCALALTMTVAPTWVSYKVGFG